MINKKLIIKIENPNPSWIKIFEETSLLNLKICNQPLIDYYLHFARHLGVKEVIVCHPFYDKKVWSYEGNNYFSFDIRCEISPNGESLEHFKKRNHNLISGHPVIAITAPVFIYFDLKNFGMVDSFRGNTDIIIDKSGQTSVVIKHLSNIREYFDLSLSIIDQYYDNYFFKEFIVKQNGVFFGRGAEVENIHSVNESSIIGKFCKVSKGSFLKRRCVVSDFSTIEGAVELEDVVLYNSVRVKPGAKFKRKIIIGSEIIDPEALSLEERGELVLKGKSISRRLYSRFAALALFIISFIPSVIVELMLLSFPKESLRYIDSTGKPYEVKRLKRNGGLSDLYEIFNFSLLKGLLKVLKGELFLIGCNDRLKKGCKDSLFSFSDFIMDLDFRVGPEVFEKFYNHRKGVFYDTITVIKFYLSKTMQLIR